MNTIQYIGARYVPKFFEGTNGSEWESGIAYEPLTVVTWLGGSWTSKKPVPSSIGAPNLNTEYWVNTGNFNQQIQEFINELTSLQLALEEQELEIDGINSDIYELNEYNITEKQSPCPTISAIYQGDIIDVDHQVTACCKANGLLYVVRSYADNIGRALLSNNGYIDVYNFETKQKLSEHSLDVGHGNSICYNPNDGYLYVAPIWDYTVSNRPPVNYIYKINPTTWSESTISTGDLTVFGVSFDYATSTMYALAWGLKLLKYTEGIGFDVLASFDNVFDRDESLQDFAIRNNVITLTSARNSGVNIKINNDGVEIISRFNASPIDSQAVFLLGEIEGMEYDETGHLLCAFLKPIDSAAKSMSGDVPARYMTCGFITELVTDAKITPYKKPVAFRNKALSQTFYLISQNTDLVLPNNYSIRRIEQRQAFVHPIERVQLSEDLQGYGTDNYIDIVGDLVLDFNSHKIYNCRGLRCYSNLKIVGTGELDVNGSDGHAFYMFRGGLFIANSANLTVKVSASGASNFVNPGGEASETYIGGSVTNEGTGGDLYVYTHVLERYTSYIGAKKVLYE